MTDCIISIILLIAQPNLIEQIDPSWVRIVDGDSSLLNRTKVRSELNISSDKYKRINGIIATLDKNLDEVIEKIAMSGKPANEINDYASMRRRERNIAVDELLFQELDKKQYLRLKQLTVQVRGYAAFVDPKILDVLKTTADQKGQLRRVFEDTKIAVRAIAGEQTQARRAENAKTKEIFNQIYIIRMQAVYPCVNLLNENQRAIWKEITGEPFEFEELK